MEIIMKSKRKALVAVNAAIARRSTEIFSGFVRVVLNSNSLDDDFRSLLLGKLRNRDWKSILELVDGDIPSGGAVQSPAMKLFIAHQVSALFKKVPWDLKAEGVDPEAEAISKFLAAERRCGRYNKRHFLRRKFGRSGPFHESTLQCAEWIRKVIGDHPNYPAVWKECRFGPGASVGVSGNNTHYAAKFLADSWSVTLTALPYALAGLRSDPGTWEPLLKKEGSPYFSWDPSLYEEALRSKVNVVDYNKIALVPKTAKVHRTIAVEPLLNGYLQNGVDVVLRRRLFRAGIDLTSQSTNQRKALLGSFDDGDPFVTIDLSDASDSISIGLARELLPPDWFHFLNSLRSPNFLLKGVVTPYEKFCSMGNGFCFPLETLIFSSVCAAIYKRHRMPPDFSVYGDDIVVRQSVAREVLELLSAFGFKHNPKKTFLHGPFRESCGADWYSGEDVRPVTVTDLPTSLADLFILHNKTLRSDVCKTFFQEGREFLRSQVPPEFRFVRPCKGNDDSAFEVELDLAMSSPHVSWNHELWSWRWKELISYSPSDRSYDRDHRYPSVLLQAALRGASSQAPFTARRNTRTRVRLISHHGGHSTWLPSQGVTMFPPAQRVPSRP